MRGWPPIGTVTSESSLPSSWLGRSPFKKSTVLLPSLPDQDNSWAEMQSRIDKTVDFLKGLRPNQLDGKDDSDVTVPMGGQPRTMKAQSYLYHLAMPQVGFHTTTAYDILRQVGVNIGKRDYLGSMPS